MKKQILIFLISTLSFISCSENSEKTSNTPYNLSIKNEKAYELYKSAKLKSQRGDYVGAKLDFEACLRIDPNFIMACLDINETNIEKKNQYLKRAFNNYNNATETEKIFIDLERENQYEKRIELFKSLININPKNSDAYYRLGNFYRQGNKLSESKSLLNKSLKLNPNNWLTNRALFGIKYAGYGDPGVGKNDENFYNFPDSISMLESDIKMLISLDTLNAAAYRKFGDIYRSSKYIDKAKEYYLKGVGVCNYEGNSYRSELMHVSGNATFLLGQVDESLKYFKESVEIEFDLYPKMKRIFQLAIVYLYDQNHKEAISVLDNFESGLNQIGFNESEINQIMVSIYNYKAFFYADMGNKRESYKCWDIFKKYADKVYEEFPEFDSSFIQQRNAALGLNSGLNDRLIRITPKNMESDFIWLNLLNGDLDSAKKIMDSSDLGSNVKSSLYLIYFSLNKDYVNASKLISKYEDNSIWWNGGNFFYAKLLLRNNMIEESRKIFNNIADGRFFGWTSGLFRKKAQIILKKL